VAKAEGNVQLQYDSREGLIIRNILGWFPYRPSVAWQQGGPIIEREHIAVRFEPECHWLFAPPEATWLANYNGVGEWHGPTPLTAAMRCYVASKLGDEIEIPEELK
jgi:hypothetical protein